MLSIHPASPQKCTPNLLPARISHNGPINDTQRYWQPETDDKGIKHVHFRGRHLHGTALPIPGGYTGAILNITEKQQAPRAPSKNNMRSQDDEDDEDEDVVPEENVDVKIAEQVGEFDEMMVWGHGEQVDGGQNMFVRGVTEWIEFAESMHIDEDEDDEKSDTKPAAT